jgi:SAM-dependent methyltransferase
MGANLPKQGEIDYFKAIGEEELQRAIDKPFSDELCGKILSDIGVIMSLLPPPPGRLIDFGCGTGWTSCFFAKRGYDVVGVDISPLAIHYAEEARAKMGLKNLSFIVSDYENLRLENAFDFAVFFYSLHHSEDYQAALKTAYHSLKAHGVCITCEPGLGHATQKPSLEAVEKYDVTERDMPPKYIIKAAGKLGFKKNETYPCLHSVKRIASDKIPFKILGGNALVRELIFLLSIVRAWLFKKSGGSIVRLIKENPDSSSRLGLKARLAVKVFRRKIKEGEALAAKITIKNTSPSVWLPGNADKGAVHLGCHLLDHQGKLIELDFYREKLTQGSGRPIGPKESVLVQARIGSPPPGAYILEFDLVAEGVCWFKDNGSPSVRVPVRVI